MVLTASHSRSGKSAVQFCSMLARQWLVRREYSGWGIGRRQRHGGREVKLESLYRQGKAPEEWYREVLAQPGFVADAAQAQAVAHLQMLYDDLLVFKARRNRFLGKTLLPQPRLPRGVYLWGGVGRGKTWLMDRFFAGLPYARKRRVHFHAFMREVHVALSQLKHCADPLVSVAGQIARKTRVLCLDEFHVSDIADAMILQRLLEELLAGGVVLLLTSNYPPQALYRDGLKRQNFLPAIALLEARLDILEVNGQADFRQRPLTSAEVYLYPQTAAHQQQLQQLVARLSAQPLQATPLELFGREFRPQGHNAELIWFDFHELCVKPRAQMDYLELAQRYPLWVLSGVPVMDSRDAAAARRFTWLIDVLYDQRVKLLVLADAAPEALYCTGDFAHEFVRVASRLREMASQQYLDAPLRKDGA